MPLSCLECFGSVSYNTTYGQALLWLECDVASAHCKGCSWRLILWHYSMHIPHEAEA